jgi:hypothetical protein
MENQYTVRDELFHVLSGTRPVRHGGIVQAIACHLENGSGPGGLVADTKLFRSAEEAALIAWIHEHRLMVEGVRLDDFVSSGAEQRVFLRDDRHVVKLNDAIFYKCWRDYLLNLLIHNVLFPDTAYELVGFTQENQRLYAMVQQPFVAADVPTDLELVRRFMQSNGFERVRNNDYYHPDWGVILEDLHDENVLTRNGVLYFIDTVFFTTDVFWRMNG